MKKTMSEGALLSLLRQEEQAASSYYSSQIAAEQDEALNRYYGDPYGDEVDGFSNVMSMDTSDVVDELVPKLVKIFDGDIVRYEPSKPEEEPFLKQAEHFMNHVWRFDNKGRKVLTDFIETGLLQKHGVIEVDWRPPEQMGPPRAYTGLTIMQVAQIDSDPKKTITAAEERTVPADEAYPDGLAYDVEVTEKDEGRIIFRGVPPEEFLIQAGAKSMDPTFEGADYVARRHRDKTVSDLIREYPDKKNALMELGDENGYDDGEGRRLDRHEDENPTSEYYEGEDPTRRRVTLLEEFIRADFDGDGFAELRYIKRTGNVILYNEEVDDHKFVQWCPWPKSHRYWGQSVADKVIPIQRTKTALERGALDSIAQAVNPNIGLRDDEHIHVNLDDIENRVPGSAIRVKGAHPTEALAPFEMRDVSDAAFKGIAYYDDQRDERTGVSRHQSGADPAVLEKSASGIQYSLAQESGTDKIEYYAGNIAEGLSQLFTKALKLLVAHQEWPRDIRIGEGEWQRFNPAEWSDRMVAKVDVGINASRKDLQLARLEKILNYQMTALSQGFPGVTPENIHYTLKLMIRVMGFANAEPFFGNPQAVQPAPEGPDTEVTKAQAEAQTKIQIAEIKAQVDKEIAEMADKRKRDELAAEAVLEREEMALEAQLEREKIQRGLSSDGNISGGNGLGGEFG